MPTGSGVFATTYTRNQANTADFHLVSTASTLIGQRYKPELRCCPWHLPGNNVGPGRETATSERQLGHRSLPIYTMKIQQVPGSSTHVVIHNDGTAVHFPSEVEARAYARDASEPVEGTTPAIPTEEPKPKKRKKHKQSR